MRFTGSSDVAFLRAKHTCDVQAPGLPTPFKVKNGICFIGHWKKVENCVKKGKEIERICPLPLVISVPLSLSTTNCVSSSLDALKYSFCYKLMLLKNSKKSNILKMCTWASMTT